MPDPSFLFAPALVDFAQGLSGPTRKSSRPALRTPIRGDREIYHWCRGVGRSRPAKRDSRWLRQHHRPEGRAVSVEQRVIAIVSDHFAYDKEKIKRSTTFIEDIGADSLDIVEFVMELEEEFDIQIPDDQAEKIKTVGEAVDYIEKAIKDKPPQ